mmetsp:Transcript_27859/g.56267  ORF Transcript_27859/g.56267 Transcript_27859/m.56267 type:complete len:305 (-) Transcript_27859:966-1880(-)
MRCQLPQPQSTYRTTRPHIHPTPCTITSLTEQNVVATITVAMEHARRTDRNGILPSQSVISPVVIQFRNIHEESGTDTFPNGLAPLIGVETVRSHNLSSLRSQPFVGVSTAPDSTKTTFQKSMQLIPHIHRSLQGPSIYESLSAFFVGQHSMGMVDEVEKMYHGDVISASIEYIRHGIVVPAPVSFVFRWVYQGSDLHGGGDGHDVSDDQFGRHGRNAILIMWIVIVIVIILIIVIPISTFVIPRLHIQRRQNHPRRPRIRWKIHHLLPQLRQLRVFVHDPQGEQTLQPVRQGLRGRDGHPIEG